MKLGVQATYEVHLEMVLVQEKKRSGIDSASSLAAQDVWHDQPRPRCHDAEPGQPLSSPNGRRTTSSCKGFTETDMPPPHYLSRTK
jgi:hypothetical protein